ncbi:MAG: histidine triad nucleotide-binding protein [Clostridia bacterium]|nr:histidine triad nucleotide-binding protein [Clostridia bacterium]
MEDCIFCKIAQGQIPSTFLYEDDQVVVINDINPQTPVHMLVLPKKHIQSLAAAQEEDRDLLGHMLMTAKNMARERGVAESGYRIIVNTGRDGAQTVQHLHMHIMGGKQLPEQMV